MHLPSARSMGLLVLCIIIPLMVGAAGSAFTLPEIAGWYAGLQKSPLNPPAWVFGPVWTLLYILMGTASWLVVRNGLGSQPVRYAVLLYAVQLGVNLGWSIIFFRMHLLFPAFITVFVLVLLIAAASAAFRKVSPTAAWLLVPYLCWTSFATFLSGAVWLLNS